MKADLTGDKQLIAKLENLKGSKVRSLVNKASRAGNKLIAKEAKKNAPKGKTGNLRRAIKVRAMKRSRVRAGTMTTLNFKGAPPYGSFVEMGTSKQRGQNFLKDAAESKGQKAADVTAAKLKELIEDV